MNEPNKQTPPPQPHAAPPPLSHPKSLAAPAVASAQMYPINRSVVVACPPYLQCYYMDSSFQICQAYHTLSVEGSSSGQSPPSPALMKLAQIMYK